MYSSPRLAGISGSLLRSGILEPENHLQEQSDDLEGCAPEKFGPPADAVDETWEIHFRPAKPPFQAGRNV